MTSKTVQIETHGLTFTADLAGPSEGDLVLLLHGFPQTRHAWRAELKSLAAAGFRACAPDQRGYSVGARPDGVDAYRIERLVADALGIADTLGAESFHLVGHDWGGHLAWVTAAQNPWTRSDAVGDLAPASGCLRPRDRGQPQAAHALAPPPRLPAR